MDLIAAELSDVNVKIETLPRQFDVSMGAVFAAQHESLFAKMEEVADAMPLYQKQLDKATKSSAVASVVELVKNDLQEWATKLVTSTADSVAEQQSAAMIEAARTQQVAVFQQLAVLQKMGQRLEDKSISRDDIRDLKGVLSTMLNTVNDNVSAVHRRMDSLEEAVGQLIAELTDLKGDIVGSINTLSAVAGDVKRIMQIGRAHV